MNKKKFIKLLQRPENISKKDISFLKDINEEFPYFQVSKAIYLKILKNNNDLKFNKFLKLTAAQTKEREILFDFINNIQDQDEKIVFNKNEINTIKENNKLDFKKNSLKKHNSFIDWLEISNIKPIDRNLDQKASNYLTKFKINYETEVKIEAENKSELDSEFDESYMTETLAKLYLSQKNYERAIQSYKILILKFPEKNSYFANQIKKIKNLKK